MQLLVWITRVDLGCVDPGKPDRELAHPEARKMAHDLASVAVV
jgi:hypothetical protein